eukprot:Hpha_TRINITY_DN1003_c0_g2::TRINITY_DN1003_c0_g2_i1::g.84758::m.84758
MFNQTMLTNCSLFDMQNRQRAEKRLKAFSRAVMLAGRWKNKNPVGAAPPGVAALEPASPTSPVLGHVRSFVNILKSPTEKQVSTTFQSTYPTGDVPDMSLLSTADHSFFRSGDASFFRTDLPDEREQSFFPDFQTERRATDDTTAGCVEESTLLSQHTMHTKEVEAAAARNALRAAVFEAAAARREEHVLRAMISASTALGVPEPPDGQAWELPDDASRRRATQSALAEIARELSSRLAILDDTSARLVNDKKRVQKEIAEAEGAAVLADTIMTGAQEDEKKWAGWWEEMGEYCRIAGRQNADDFKPLLGGAGAGTRAAKAAAEKARVAVEK